jgi:hypothetical protein
MIDDHEPQLGSSCLDLTHLFVASLNGNSYDRGILTDEVLTSIGVAN